MKILVIRETILADGTTIGSMYLDDKYFCKTLEDPIRDLLTEKKVYGDTAIPAGIYNVIINYSSKFRKQMPLIQNVPHFRGIRIHGGMTKKHTLGCILIGMKVERNRLFNSHIAYNWLFLNLKTWLTQGKVTIEILNLATSESLT